MKLKCSIREGSLLNKEGRKGGFDKGRDTKRRNQKNGGGEKEIAFCRRARLSQYKTIRTSEGIERGRGEEGMVELMGH